MMLRKACPRCRGDLYFDRNDGPVTLNCLQCGRMFAPNALAPAAGHEPIAIRGAGDERAA